MSKALASARIVKPVSSTNAKEARAAVLSVYKKLQRMLPITWWDCYLTDVPLPMFREVIKNQFLKNQRFTDIRVIDRKVAETNEHIKSMQLGFYTPPMLRNYLFGENLEPKPKDFLSRFLQGKE